MSRLRYLLVLLICIPSFLLAEDSTALIRAGEGKLQAGEVDAAIGLLEQAIAADAGSSLAYTRLGGALLLKQRHEEAIERFRAAIGLNAGNADAFVGMAIADIHLGRHALARAALQEAKRLDPEKGTEADRLIAWIDRRLEE
ncbi:tetratricopeptide repeat protein [Thiocystis violacea]|uniref:tetratricopeptide repeat protein n=1 Tax=Thiocystis violacea TaxID=13725 RepID=UPI0019070E5D|nr:tetratricopeptide repeat protein [Thiocystis violacea]MBK1717545.1 hypothetical protein [Thiocystis violacea]